MRRSFGGVVLMLIVALAAAGCDPADPTTPTTPTPPVVPVTETFAGALTVNGAVTYFFSAGTAGSVTATLTALSPETVEVGLALGTWNGVICQVVLANDKAIQGSVVTGSVSATGTLCVRLYDVGKLTQSNTFELVVVHP